MAHPQLEQSLPSCANCGRSIGRLEQKYDYDGQIVCAACAAMLSAAADATSTEPEAYSAADTVSFSATPSSPSPRRGGSGRRSAKKKSPVAGLIAVGVGFFAVSGVMLYLYKSGTLDKFMTQTKSNVTGVTAENEKSAHYNTLITAGSNLAKDKKYGEAAAKLREAKTFLDANRSVLLSLHQDEINQLNETITKYENYAKGVFDQPAPPPPKPGPASAVEKPKPAPAVNPPKNVEFMDNKPPAEPALPLVVVEPKPPAKVEDRGTIPMPDDAIEESPKDKQGALPDVVEAPIVAGPAPVRPVAPPEPEKIESTPVAKPSVDLTSNDPDALAKAGWTKMRDGDVGTADQLFKKSLQLAANDKSTIGQAVLPAFAQKPGEAIARLEKLVAQRNARAAATNLASLHLKDNPMRAAKILRDHLTLQKSAIDETTLDYLGVAIRQAEQKGGAVGIKELTAFYEQCEATLAKSHPGQKRWGNTWIAAADADRKRAALVKQRSAVESAQAAQRTAQTRADRARQQVNDRRGNASTDEMMSLRQGAAEAEKAATDAKTAAEKALREYEALEQAPLPETIPIVEP